MEITDEEMARAEAAGQATRAAGYATAARYDAAAERLVVRLQTSVELAIPVRLIEGLAGQDPAEFAAVEISAGGLGLHWPAIDADVYVPGLMKGVYGTRRWMDRLLAEQLADLQTSEEDATQPPTGA